MTWWCATQILPPGETSSPAAENAFGRQPAAISCLTVGLGQPESQSSQCGSQLATEQIGSLRTWLFWAIADLLWWAVIALQHPLGSAEILSACTAVQRFSLPKPSSHPLLSQVLRLNDNFTCLIQFSASASGEYNLWLQRNRHVSVDPEERRLGMEIAFWEGLPYMDTKTLRIHAVLWGRRSVGSENRSKK